MKKNDSDSIAVEINSDFVQNENSDEVYGEMVTPGSTGGANSDEYNTLDEPIRNTVMRDLKAVGNKFFYVLYPVEKKTLLREWDLWGPLILCTFLAMTLQSSQEANELHDGGPQFAEVFVVVWVGSAIITLNSKLLGGNISFFQSVCVLGYCLLPSAISLIVCKAILIGGGSESNNLFMVRFAVTTFGFCWASYAAMKFLGDSQPRSRKALAMYPIFLFYFFISWMIISHSN